jgi:hypothetical protein
MSENLSPGITYLYGVLYYENRLWVPKDEFLRQEILESEHHSKVAGHMGQDKTVELIRQNVFWPEMDTDIREYIRIYLTCQYYKHLRHAQYGFYYLLELLYALWDSITMDFIIELPLSNGYLQIWVIIDCITKMGYFIPLKYSKTKAKDLMQIFAGNI